MEPALACKHCVSKLSPHMKSGTAEETTEEWCFSDPSQEWGHKDISVPQLGERYLGTHEENMSERSRLSQRAQDQVRNIYTVAEGEWAWEIKSPQGATHEGDHSLVSFLEQFHILIVKMSGHAHSQA